MPYWLRLLLSVWLAWHVFAVFMAPMSLQPKPSQLAVNTAQGPWLSWYTSPLFFNGGYSFFSPDPPMSGQLIRYKVYGEGQQPIVEGEFPNRNNPKYATQWPRLWYHRHMMLVDQSGNMPILEPPAEESADPQVREELQRRLAEQNHQLALRSFARHLLRKHRGKAVQLELIEHMSLGFEAVREGVEPTDPRLYRVVKSVVEREDQLAQPLVPEQTSRGAEPLPQGRGA
ncbi:MAG: hypothetical protein KDA37_02630 [Planctomycetales bacterium]|nr:hypothetical protein [Planctomycetales bacterium]